MQKIYLLPILVIFLIWSSGCATSLLYIGEWKANLDEKQITLDSNINISYLERESATPKSETILLVHGFTGNKYNWLNIAKKIDASYRLLILDLPGHGKSYSALDFNFDVENMANIIKKFTNKLNLGKHHVIGHSMGGAISLVYASSNDVVSLVLIDSAGLNSESSDLQEAVKKNILGVHSLEDYKNFLAFMMEKIPYMPESLIKKFAEEHIAKIDIFTKVIQDNMKYTNAFFKDLAANFNAPSLIVWGEQDKIIPVQYAEEFDRLLPYSEKHILPGIGHTPILEDITITSKIMNNFLSKN
ncbi:alpha/beta hydrolase [Gammaproteobacteria bacterium]|nr:alpha/beta hydrolase [Gammaproteobacteria bacterium]